MTINRKEFLKKIWGLILLPYLLFLVLMTKKHVQVASPKQIRLNKNIPEGITFYDDVICIKSGEELIIYSSRCTHLGCRINKSTQETLICPCHGSSFGIDGKVLEGPALKSLRVLEYKIDQGKNEIIIRL